MSNRTDYGALAGELAAQFGLSQLARERIETELHNAHVAGREGSQCACRWCVRATREPPICIQSPDGLHSKRATADACYWCWTPMRDPKP